jgi:glycosyltransferase involved in cell wall biosynthesis
LSALKNIRVCHFASVHTIDDTRVFHRQCISLAKDFDVYLIGIGNFEGIKSGVHVIGIPKPPSRIYRLFITTWVVFFKALIINARIYHIHDAELLPFAFFLRLIGKKVIYDIHENTYQDFENKPWIPNILKPILASIYKLSECFTAKFFHFILVIAKPDFAKRFCTNNYTIIQNYVDIKSIEPYANTKRSQLQQFDIFYMGTIHDMYYNFHPIVEAIHLLRKSGIDVKLHVAGYAKDYLQNHFRLNPYYEDTHLHITFYGVIKPQEAFEISQKCKVAFCLKNQPEAILMSHERKFFEYMALGMPIICAKSDIYVDVLKHYPFGIAVDLTNAFEIAEAFRKLLPAVLELDQMSAIAQKAAIKYNWDSEYKKLNSLYKQLLGM